MSFYNSTYVMTLKTEQVGSFSDFLHDLIFNKGQQEIPKETKVLQSYIPNIVEMKNSSFAITIILSFSSKEENEIFQTKINNLKNFKS